MKERFCKMYNHKDIQGLNEFDVAGGGKINEEKVIHKPLMIPIAIFKKFSKTTIS